MRVCMWIVVVAACSDPAPHSPVPDLPPYVAPAAPPPAQVVQVADDTVSVADFGPGWQELRPDPHDLRSALASIHADGDLAIAVGAAGLIERTDDGGYDWTRIDPGTAAEPEADGTIRPFGAVWGEGQRWVLVGADNGIVAVSADGGRSWTRRSLATDFAASAVWGAGSDVYVAGSGGIEVSHDDGDSWTLADGIDGRIDAIAGGGGRVYAVGSNGQTPTMVRSIDHGRHWSALRLPAIATMNEARAVAVLDDGTVLAHLDPPAVLHTPNHTLLRSRDGGESWAIVPIDYCGPEDALADGSWQLVHLWAGGGRIVYASIHGKNVGALQISRDGGDTWHLFSDADVAGIAVANDHIYTVAGDGGGARIRVLHPGFTHTR